MVHRSIKATLLAVMICTASVSAAVKLPALIGDHMVLQQSVPVRIWGTADTGEAVTVNFCGQRVSTTAAKDGGWQVRLKPLPAGGPFEMTIVGKNTLTIKDILVGEVWVGSGQSNMWWTVSLSANPEKEIAQADYPDIHLFTVAQVPSVVPLRETQGAWVGCDPKTVGGFSAVAYYFGRELHKTLKVPVGLIHSSWGGTPAETWTSLEALSADSDLKDMIDGWKKYKKEYPQLKAKYDSQAAQWKKDVELAKSQNKPASAEPRPPTDPDCAGQPTVLYNGMIAPIVPYTIRGAIWYQGESNADRPVQYRKLFPAMIRDWRKAWGQGDFPFLFVQLANYTAVQTEPCQTGWAELREAQTMTLSVPNTGMATAIDIGAANDIHPKNKQDVGKRLALAAEAKVYGKKVEFSGPMYASMQVESGAVRIKFTHAAGLTTRNHEPVKGFAIAGPDGKFVWADAKIEGDTVLVSSKAVAKPVAVRYAWANNPICNLYNGAGLPAVPFRTDRR